jgi:hypothetical protein
MNVVMYSSGIGSWAAAKRVAAQHGTENLILLFADTLIEDEDNYRFLEESAADIGGTLVRVADGRDPWQVYRDKRWIGNARLAPCSHELKQKPCRRWLEENDPQHQATLYVGIDWSESHRLLAIQNAWKPWLVEAPLTKAPYLDKSQLLDMAQQIKAPQMYSKSFHHANCGGFCSRGGQAHFANLLKHYPERYQHHEQQEQELREYLGKNVAILREQVKNEKIPLTLAELRRRIESRPQQLDLFDWGGCGCFAATGEEVAA